MTQAVAAQPALTADRRLNDLEQIIGAYHVATENLQKSHEHLRSEVARLQEELAGANAQLQRSKRLAALGEMAAGIAHEVRNPLAAIGLYARMIGEDLSVADHESVAADNARKIVDAVRGLDAIVRDVLTFAGEISTRPSHVLCADLIERTIATHLPIIEQSDVKVAVKVEENTVVNVDADLLHQALLNLVRNATDAMQASGGTLCISVEEREHGIVIIVRDTGPGIEEDAIDRIFNPFFTTRGTGTGLGLAIVHRIIDAHGGVINVFNDGGAVFELTVPRYDKELCGDLIV